jgi:hypothetical protein
VRWCALLLLLVGCGKHLNPAWCAQPGHDDPACQDLLDASTERCAIGSCPGTACLPDGSCAAPGSVLYASPDGTGTSCTGDAKCQLATAIDQSTPTRNIISLDRGTYSGPIAIDRSVQIIGHSATLAGSSVGAAVTVINAVSAEIDDLTITGASGGAGVACSSGTLVMWLVQVLNNQVGVTSACTLKLSRSIIRDNDDGAIAITSGDIDVRNNVIFHNGNPALKRSANVTIAAGVTGAFAFNTVAFNDAKQNSTPGIECESAAVDATGNLVTDNTHKGAYNVDPQVTGTCDFTRSYTMPGIGGNDVGWISPTADLHLTRDATTVLDKLAAPCGAIDDFDGDHRPFGDGCDYGADEFAH